MAKKTSPSPIVTLFDSIQAFLNSHDIVDESVTPAHGKTWADGIVAVFRDGSDGVKQLLILVDQAADLFGESDWETLETLVYGEDGFNVRAKLNGETRRVVKINYTALKKAYKAEEIEGSQLIIAHRTIRDLERKLKEKGDECATDQAMADLVAAITPEAVKDKPDPLAFQRKLSEAAGDGGIPTLFLSDWHWGEVVDPRQIEGINEYNLKIAHARCDRVFTTAADILTSRLGGQTYGGICLPLGGDMVSGNIHEELQRTNDVNILPCCADLAKKIASGILMMADIFKWVYVPCVVGNHGRLDRKPTAKAKVIDNFDWLVYHMVQGYCAHKTNILVDISEAADMRFNLYSTRYLLTHGDQVKGGQGVGGIWPSMMKADQRKRKRHQISGDGYDYMMCGHFHRYGTVDNIIVNGSLKGYDEWVYTMNFDAEPARQALWMTDPRLGITMHMPIYGDQIKAVETKEPVALFSRP